MYKYVKGALARELSMPTSPSLVVSHRRFPEELERCINGHISYCSNDSRQIYRIEHSIVDIVAILQHDMQGVIRQL